MARSPDSERVRRLNAAVELVQKYGANAEAARVFAERYGVSLRQAYRYVREAHAQRRPLPVPEPKVVFTVKLPERENAQRDRIAGVGDVSPQGQTSWSRLETRERSRRNSVLTGCRLKSCRRPTKFSSPTSYGNY
jgi:hypothetical protein